MADSDAIEAEAMIAVEKPEEQKPMEEKPMEEKPMEEKPVEEKPVEEKPMEEKPMEEKKMEEKPMEEKPMEEKPMEEKPTEEKPKEEKLMEEQPDEQTADDKSIEFKTDSEAEKYEDNETFTSMSDSLDGDTDKKRRRQERREKRAARLELQKKADFDGHRQVVKSPATSEPPSENLSRDVSFEKMTEDDPDSHDIKRARSTMLLDDSYENRLMEAIEEEESNSIQSVASEAGYCTVRYKDDFLNYFEDLPSLSELSSDMSMFSTKRGTSITQHSDSVEEEMEDKGVFVDPLTGELVESSSSESSESGEMVAEEFTGEQEDELISMPSVMEVTEKLPAIQFDDELIQFENVQPADEEDAVIIETPAQIHARQMFQISYEFVTDLINTVVETAEQRSEKVKLANSIDRIKLYDSLTETTTELQNAKYANNELTQKVIEFYKRRKLFRCIVSLPIEEELKEVKRYERKLMYYDHLIQKQASYKRLHDEQRASRALQIEENERLAIESKQRLEDTIRETFAERKFDNYRSQIENYIRQLHKKRDDISAIRLTLTHRQHVEATLLEKLAGLDKINANLQMSTFVSIQTQVISMQKKIEERSNDFNKIRTYCNGELVNAAHLRELIDMLQRTIESDKNDQQNLIDEHRKRREYLFKLKIEHVRIRKLTLETNFQGGLLERTVLMHDFDDTSVAVQALHKKTKHMRDNLNALAHRIDIAENELFAVRAQSVYSQK